MPKSRDSMIRSPYAFRYADIPTRTPDRKVILKNMLREVNQKFILNSKQSRRLRKELYDADAGKYKCPFCKNHVSQLTNAHVGPSVASIIDDILETHSKEQDILVLYNELKQRHAATVLVVCCHKCNKTLED